jgi:hypothetical protein
MTRSRIVSPWARYEPTSEDPWDLHKAAHLHRRAGIGATWTELLRDREVGPDASVDHLFQPRPLTTVEAEADEAIRRVASLDLLKVCWLNRILRGPDPLREKTYELDRRRRLGPVRERPDPVRPARVGGPLQAVRGPRRGGIVRSVARGRARRQRAAAGN